MDWLSILEAILIIGVLCGMIYAVISWVPMPEPFKSIAIGILAIVIIILVFNVLRGDDLGFVRLGR